MACGCDGIGDGECGWDDASCGLLVVKLFPSVLRDELSVRRSTEMVGGFGWMGEVKWSLEEKAGSDCGMVSAHAMYLAVSGVVVRGNLMRSW